MKRFSWKLALIIMAIVVSVVLMVVFAVNSVQNHAISLEEQINEASSAIEVQEKRRADLLPNLVDCVKAYDKHEYETLINVIEARGTNSEASAEEIKTMINAVAEAYPELKSNENYKELQKELATTENLISNYRNNFNAFVKEYKRYVRKFPNKQVLDMLGYEAVEFEYLEYGTSSDAPTNLFGEN